MLSQGSGDGFVWVRLWHVTVYSVYLSPNYSAHEYQEKLEALGDSLRGISGDLIVAGDLNERAVEWGMPVTNVRGRHILELASRLDLEVANTGTLPTFRRPGFGNSIPDVTLVSARLFPLVAEWKVMDMYNQLKLQAQGAAQAAPWSEGCLGDL